MPQFFLSLASIPHTLGLVLVHLALQPNPKCVFSKLSNFFDMQIQRQTFSGHRARSATLALAGVFAALLTAGCGAAAPGNAEAKNFLEGRFSGCPLWTISNARKIDSVQRGDKYQLDYEATLTIREDFARSTYASVRGFVDDPRNKPCMGEMGNVVAGMAGAVNPQTRQTVLRGAVLLIQSEQGWRLLRGPEEEFVMPGR